MKPQFLVEFAFDAHASEESTQPTNQVSQHGGSG
jgi:hypothetical protein